MATLHSPLRTLHTRDHKKTEKRRTENLVDVTRVPVGSNVRVFPSFKHNLWFRGNKHKNRKGKTTARTIKKLVVKVRGVRGGAAQSPRGPGGNPSAAALRPALIPTALKGYGD